MANGSSDENSRVTVAILKTNMGHIEKILKDGFGEAKERDQDLSAGLDKQQGQLNEMQVTLAVQESALKQVVTNEADIDELKTDVAGLKAVSQRWGIAGIGTSITALAAAAYAAFKSEVLGQ